MAIIFGVVPEEISAVEAGDRAAGDGDEAERENFPAKTGPVPSTNRVKAGSCSSGPDEDTPTPSSSTTPSFTNVLR